MALNGPQRKVLTAVRVIEADDGVASVEAIGQQMGFPDTASISVWIERLVFDNYLTRYDTPESFGLTADGLEALTADS